jgi:SNF2 family DNA or RNA helicase
MLSQEIDNNPFLVFQIHNVNLISELSKRGINIESNKNTEIASLAEWFKSDNKKKISDFDTDQAYERIDFSQLQSITEPLIKILPDAPPFYNQGNFRDQYATAIHKITKEAGRIFKKSLKLEDYFPTSRVTSPLSHHTESRIMVNYNGDWEVINQQQKATKNEEFLLQLWQLNPDHLADYQPSVAALHKTLFAALHLLANGAVVPQIVQLENKKFYIRWLPALIDNRVKALCSRLKTILPPDLLLSQQMLRSYETTLLVGNPEINILTLFLTLLVSRFSGSGFMDEIMALFFKNHPYNFMGVGENSLSGGIKVWLDRFFLTSEYFKPIITVNEQIENTFEVSITIEDTSNPDQLPISLNAILTQEKHQTHRFKILQSLTLFSPFIKGLDEHINQMAIKPITFDFKEFAPFLMYLLPSIRLLDIKTLLPKSLQVLLRPKASVRLKSKSKTEASFIRLDDLLTFDWQIAIGDQVMTPEEYKILIRNASGLMKFKEQYIYVDESDLEKLNKHFTNSKPLTSYQLLQTALMEEYEGTPVILTSEVKKMIKELTSDKDIPLPQGLQAILRPYQYRGFSWMYRNIKIGFGSILADDMGLGKTVQVIAILVKLKEEGAINAKQKALIVVPTGLLNNWQAEIEKFAPSLTTHIYHGTTRDLKDFTAEVMISTYGVVRSDTDLLKKRKWQILVIDEAQNIKNNDTAQCKMVKSLSSNIRIALSGTPVENRLSEFWSIMDFTNKGYLGNEKSFKDEFASPIQLFNDEHAISRFRRVTAPFLMRRLKSDKTIISDLPDKIEQNQYNTLTKSQAVLYEKTLQIAMEKIEGISASDHESMFKRQGLVLQMILALKQICNHPTQFLKNGKTDYTLSGKSILLLDMLESIIDSGEKVLIFTQFREMGNLLQQFISERLGEEAMFLHGGCNIKTRQEMVDRFQNNRADKIFLLSLKAAGTGLNLTAATQVIHYDLWWNPAVEAQATDRAYRIGQKKNVQVHRFITKNTFEERIDEMIQKKKHLADMTVATGENWIGKFSNKELREIFG